jgi:Fe-S-cluster containining protein
MNICTTCTHSIQAPIDPDNIGAERPVVCRRYPLSVFPMQSARGIGAITLRPTVQPNDTCGEWEGKAVMR